MYHMNDEVPQIKSEDGAKDTNNDTSKNFSFWLPCYQNQICMVFLIAVSNPLNSFYFF